MELDDTRLLGQRDRELDGQVKRCFLGYARGRVLGGPYELEFGRWNPRALDVTQAKKLADNMVKTDIRGFRASSAIPIIVRRSDLAVELDVREDALSNPGQLPELLFTQGRGHRVTAAGGRHRHAALKLLVKQYDEDIKRGAERLAVLERKKGGKDEDLEERNGVFARLKDIKERRQILDRWAFAVYDEGE
jgi:hypothetical protein